MPSFVSGGSTTTPFGRNEYRRSTHDGLFESYTLAGSTIPTQTIDGAPGQKIVQPGTVMAKITSGGDVGKVGPFQAGATDGRQTAANIVGINDTFLPYQTMDRDVEIACLYKGTCVQAWCIEYDSTPLPVVLTNTTADALRGTKGLDILFK